MARQPNRTGPEQRYWRRRANRRVRKARRIRTVLRWSAILTLNGVVAGVLLYSGFHTVRRISHLPGFALERVDIEGTARASNARIRATLTPYLRQNLFDLNLAEIEAVVNRDPWVRHTTVKRVLPDGILIRVSERVPAALAVIDGVAHLVDDVGYVIGPTGSGLTDNLPVIVGLPTEEAALAAALRRGVRFVRRLRLTDNGFTRRISELDLSRGDRVTIRTITPGPMLLLDPVQVERNLLRYLDVEHGLSQRVGSVNYVDLRWQDRISVMPAMKGGK